MSKKDLSIRLSPEYGFNPAIAFCPRCGEENGEMLLLGDIIEYVCGCGQVILGRPGDRRRPCPACGSKNRTRGGKYQGQTNDKRLTGNLCPACKAEQEQFKSEVERGGVYWRCKTCHSEGVLKADHPLAPKVRESAGVPQGPVGVELEECPACCHKQ